MTDQPRYEPEPLEVMAKYELNGSRTDLINALEASPDFGKKDPFDSHDHRYEWRNGEAYVKIEVSNNTFTVQAYGDGPADELLPAEDYTSKTIDYQHPTDGELAKRKPSEEGWAPSNDEDDGDTSNLAQRPPR